MARTLTRTASKSPSATARLLCLVNRHQPVGRRADWDGASYISRCEHCQAPIFRLKKGKWRRDRRRRGGQDRL
ncbi:MAG: hypothetical protein KDE15_13435 [Erythrobacter sp.]|nr:hypothetical protein [Erythrobacter sp.]